jgi:signal transduction histidine kinase
MDNAPTQSETSALQIGLGEPLRSEQRTSELLPRVLSPIDMLAIFIAIVLFIPNASIIQATQGAGTAVYVYWIIGTVTFLIPGAVVTGQLSRFMPAEGSIYVWTHHALGPLWGFFAGFCSWFPGVLVLLASSVSVYELLQGVCSLIWNTNVLWFNATWQQGVIVLVVLLVTGWLATRPLALLMRLVKWVIALYGVAILIVGLAGAVWLLSGHPFPFAFSFGNLGLGGQNIVLYGVIVLALLGVEVPLNMSAETRYPHASRLFLRWGPILVLIGYLLGTFGVMEVVPASLSSVSYSTIIAVRIAFGVPLAALVGVIFIAFFIIVTIVYQIAFSRFLFTPALDHRLPASFAFVNRHLSPSRAVNIQTIIISCITLTVYFIAPLLYPGEGGDFSAKVYDVTQATTTVIWCVSMIILFLDLPLLLARFRTSLPGRKDLFIASPWLLYLCCLTGGLASVMGIWTTLRISWDATLIPDDQWTILIVICTLIVLAIGLVGSAYPRLLSSLEEQTSAARENAHLYAELRVAYAKLSELDQLKDAFIRTASHELRTPLTIVQGYLELLRVMEDADAKTRQEFLDKACRACEELVVLQANIMDANRIDSDRIKLYCTPIVLKDIITMVVELSEPLILQKKHRFETDVDTSIVVLADEVRLKQILHNLISNAIRYSPPQTLIRIVAKKDLVERKVIIQIIDHGFGIPLDKQNIIFDRFVRLERDMHGMVRGSGLGLYITRQLVEAMEGTILVKSSGVENEGSTFSFTLPLVGNRVVERE